MAPERTRSAALLISVYIDTESGAPWYAQLRGFEEPWSTEFLTRPVADEDALIAAIKGWLESVLDRP